MADRSSRTSTRSAEVGPCRNAAVCGGEAPFVELLGSSLRGLCDGCVADLDREEEAARGRLLERALRRAGGERRFASWTLDSHPSPAAAEVAREWLAAHARGERRNLWLVGPVGTAKTGLAWGIVRSRVESYVAALDGDEIVAEPDAPALLVGWRDLLADLRATIGQQPGEAGGEVDPARVLERARRVPILALDDLGAERPTAYALEELAGLVDRRWKSELATIVTSNYGSRDLAARLGHEERVVGERIVSRLLDGTVAFRFEGPSLRRVAP